MDLLSGGMIGIYLSVYILILISFRNATVYFHFKNSSLFQMVIILSVVVENMIFCLVSFLQTFTFNFSLYSGRVILIQLFSALVSSPIIYFMLDFAFYEIDKLITGGLREKV